MGPVPGAGGAGCSSPAGVEGNIIYNKDYYALQYCDGTNWVAMGTRTLTGLVGWWNLDEGSGTSAADSSGNGNTGTLQAAASWQPSGKIGGALSFSGTADGVRVPNSPTWQINGLTGYSISFWIKVKAIGDYKGAVAVGPWSAPGFNFYTVANTWYAHIPFSSNGCDIFSGPVLPYLTTPDNQFHLVTLVADSSAGNCTFYSDGAFYHSDPIVTGTTNFGAGDLMFGGFDGSNWLNSDIDDVRIYNRALSAGEIAHIYNGGP